jgi:hypothetical protein
MWTWGEGTRTGTGRVNHSVEQSEGEFLDVQSITGKIVRVTSSCRTAVDQFCCCR